MRYILYCENNGQEALDQITAALRNGVDVEYTQPDKDNRIMLCVRDQKQKGRPKTIKIDINYVVSCLENGVSIDDIANEVGCSSSYLYRLVRTEKLKQQQSR